MGKLRNLINDYLQNKCNYEYLEDYMIQYLKENHKSLNLDYVKARIEDMYNIQGIVGISTMNILLHDLLECFRIKKIG